MKNIERLANYVTKNGSESILIHTIPKTGNWIICQKISEDKWSLSLSNPMGNVTYNLGVVTDEQHFELWKEIVNINIENKNSQVQQSKQLISKINNFKKNYVNSYKIYKKFTKIEEKENGIEHKNTTKNPRKLGKGQSTISRARTYKELIKSKINKYQKKDKQTKPRTSKRYPRS